MTNETDPQTVVFQNGAKVAAGSLSEITAKLRDRVRAGETFMVFDPTGRLLDIDAREPNPTKTGRGRPKLGVISKEVTLLPRHWDWLAKQPGGASIALRKLVENAIRAPETATRQSQDAAYRFMTAMAGDLPTYEEAIRALYAADRLKFLGQTETWPADIRAHARTLAEPAFS
jgi:uncharacterized protein